METKATTEWHGKPLYKVLTNGESQNGGTMKWSLPTPTKAGKWHKHEGRVKRCSSGFHVTTEPYRWVGIDSKLYFAEVKGTVDGSDSDDKIAVSQCRLLREAPHEQWWLNSLEFIRSIKDVPFFSNSGTLPKSKKIKLFDNRAAADAAWVAARDAAWNAARDAALFTCAIHIGSGLNIQKKHIDHAKLRWAVWEAGYGVHGDVDGILYCYKGKP